MPKERDLRVCFIGDSFVAGTGDPSALGWVGRVTQAAFTGGLPITAYNLGIRRDTSVLVAKRAHAELLPRLAPATDKRVIASFGVNDTLIEHDAQRASTQETLHALRSLAAQTRAAAARLMLIGPPAVDDDRHNERIRALDSALREESVTLTIPYRSSVISTQRNAIWRTEVRDGDHYHPGAAGYEQLAALHAGPIVEWLTAE